MKYCQGGIQVYFITETQEYTYHDIYGHYELQQGNKNGRPYFKMGNGMYDIWFDGSSYWVIGDWFAYYTSDVFCPHQLIQGNWKLFNGKSYYKAGEDLYLTCK